MLHTEALAFLLDGDPGRADAVFARAFDAYWTSALVYAWAARAAALHRGDLDAAREHLGRAAGLRPLLTHALPVVSVQALLDLARAYIALDDPDGAPAVLRQADDIFQQLFVTQNTVKTQAISVYRKLGVSSRSDAVQHAQQLGLLGR